jgi:hypothetical protein
MEKFSKSKRSHFNTTRITSNMAPDICPLPIALLLSRKIRRGTSQEILEGVVDVQQQEQKRRYQQNYISKT